MNMFFKAPQKRHKNVKNHMETLANVFFLSSRSVNSSSARGCFGTCVMLFIHLLTMMSIQHYGMTEKSDIVERDLCWSGKRRLKWKLSWKEALWRDFCESLMRSLAVCFDDGDIIWRWIFNENILVLGIWHRRSYKHILLPGWRVGKLNIELFL